MDFACKQVKIEEILKCGFSLTKVEVEILRYLINNSYLEFTSQELAQKLKLDLTTLQKATKKFSEKGILTKFQQNLEHGGYTFRYKLVEKSLIKEKVLGIVHVWVRNVEQEFCNF